MAGKSRSVSLAVVPDPRYPPTRLFENLPWYPGLRVLDLLVLADAAIADTFTFRALYGSDYGVFIDQIDGISEAPACFWMLYANGTLSERGISETLIDRPDIKIEFRLEEPPIGHPQTEARVALSTAMLR